MPSTPPPVPQGGGSPAPLQYAVPVPKPVDQTPKLIDTVGGPNLRLFDNLVQLACVIAGGAIGFYACKLLRPVVIEPGIGAILGAIAALFISGLVLGIVRHRKARRK